ncbi:uncharacterized protein LOC112499884 [Cynara cardunculus var. scolymus]|uniref:uncharacterized protein LOC112499884 n=1 Tax=Cynara cardunculus var. scolymus TaxID=59895 RepID=UPI000D62D75C|nr:uncharacterized protein LOC112499884 [Cynara cardunculus var. scolymus]
MGDNPPPREATVNIADDKNRGIRDYATPEFGQLAAGIGIHEIDVISALNAQIVALTNLAKNNLRLNGENNQVQSIMSNPPMPESCVFYGEGHSYEYCPKNPVSVNYVGSHARNSPFSPTYNSNWRNHLNFSWTGNPGLQPPGVTQVQNRPQNPPGYGQGASHNYQNGQSSHSYMPRQNALDGNGSLESLLKGFKNQTNATLRSFETQLGQFAADLMGRTLGTLPSDTETPKGKEHIKAVTVLSEESSKVNDDINETVEEPTHQNEKTVPISTSSNVHLSIEKPDSGKIVPTVQPNRSVQTAPNLQNLPFLERMKSKNVDEQFKKFLDIFKQLHINIPLVEALEQMPSYVKFLKDILHKKRRLNEFETVALTKECSAFLTCKISPKLKDPGSFTIPCSIGGKAVGHALCDLGASINLMPLSVFNKLGIGEVRPTTVTLQLADRSIAYPKAKIEDILVQVDKFIFQADFLVLDYEADKNVPIILERPFLAIRRTLIGVQKGELTMRVSDQEVKFNMFNSLKFHGEVGDCSVISALGEDLEISLIDIPYKNNIGENLEDILEENDELEDLEDLEDLAAFEQLDFKDRIVQPPSIEKAPDLELKPLPSHLKYVYLMEEEKLPVIISSKLSN